MSQSAPEENVPAALLSCSCVAIVMNPSSPELLVSCTCFLWPIETKSPIKLDFGPRKGSRTG